MAEAIRLCESESFDAALIDLQLPDSNAAQSLESIDFILKLRPRS